MRIERYIFGSVRGYGQLARSSGISQADARFFDTVSFGFGQANDPSFADSLLDKPAFFTYRVPAGRWAVVRVLKGHPDVKGRPTLLMIWLVFTRADWKGVLGLNPQTLLDTSDLWRYTGESTLPALEITIPPSASQARPELTDWLAVLLRELVHNATSKRSTIVSAEDFTAGEILRMAAAAPPQLQAKMTIACRSLSNKFPVMLNLIANGSASSAGSRATAGVTLSEAETASEIEPPLFETDPSILKTHRSVPEPPMPPPLTAPSSKPQMLNPAMFVLSIIAVVGPILSYIVAHNQDKTSANELQQRVDAMDRQLGEQAARIDTLRQIDVKRLDDLQAVHQTRIDSQDQAMSRMRAESAQRYAPIDEFEVTKRQLEALAKQMEKPSQKNNKSPNTSQPSTLPATRQGKS